MAAFVSNSNAIRAGYVYCSLPLSAQAEPRTEGWSWGCGLAGPSMAPTSISLDAATKKVVANNTTVLMHTDRAGSPSPPSSSSSSWELDTQLAQSASVAFDNRF
eukprot:970393-Amphidinium_carterae.1